MKIGLADGSFFGSSLYLCLSRKLFWRGVWLMNILDTLRGDYHAPMKGEWFLQVLAWMVSSSDKCMLGVEKLSFWDVGSPAARV